MFDRELLSNKWTWFGLSRVKATHQKEEPSLVSVCLVLNSSGEIVASPSVDVIPGPRGQTGLLSSPPPGLSH